MLVFCDVMSERFIWDPDDAGGACRVAQRSRMENGSLASAVTFRTRSCAYSPATTLWVWSRPRHWSETGKLLGLPQQWIYILT
jgi:hypothetical protein